MIISQSFDVRRGLKGEMQSPLFRGGLKGSAKRSFRGSSLDQVRFGCV